MAKPVLMLGKRSHDLHDDRRLPVILERGIEPLRVDLPENFWNRVKPSVLMATLMINMCIAADKAHRSGRFKQANEKYMKAIFYLEPALSQYTHDPEMLEWTEDLQELLRKRRGLLRFDHHNLPVSTARVVHNQNLVNFVFGTKLRPSAVDAHMLCFGPEAQSNQGE